MDEIESVFSFREVPWHKKGIIVDHALTAKEAITLAGLDWQVELYPITIAGIEIEDHFATVRTDVFRVLGIVGSKYTVMQNEDLFGFFDPVVEREEGAFYHTGGSLLEGKKVWLLAKVPGDFYVPGVADDKIDNYILLASSHDGSLHVTVKHTMVRVVCCNTLAMALKGGETTIKIKHTASAKYELAAAHKVLGLATRRASMVEQVAKALVNVQVRARDLGTFLKCIFPSEMERRTGKPHPLVKRHRDRVELLFAGSMTNNLPGMPGSAWALYNAVTEYADHEKPIRTGVDELDRMWFGAGESLKLKAFRLLMQKVNGQDWEET